MLIAQLNIILKTDAVKWQARKIQQAVKINKVK